MPVRGTMHAKRAKRSTRARRLAAGSINAAFVAALKANNRGFGWIMANLSRDDIVKCVRVAKGTCASTKKPIAARILVGAVHGPLLPGHPLLQSGIHEAEPASDASHSDADDSSVSSEETDDSLALNHHLANLANLPEDPWSDTEGEEPPQHEQVPTTYFAVSESLVADSSIVQEADAVAGFGRITEMQGVFTGHLCAGSATTKGRSSKAFAKALANAILGEQSYYKAFGVDKARQASFLRVPQQIRTPAFDCEATAQHARHMGAGSSGNTTDHHPHLESACGFSLSSAGIESALDKLTAARLSKPSQIRKIMQSAARTDQTEEACRAMAKLHEPSVAGSEVLPAEMHPDEVDQMDDMYLIEMLHTAVYRTKHATAVGPDGVSRGILDLLLADTRQPLLVLLKRLLKGTLSDDEKLLVSSATLLGVPKENGSVRPISIGTGLGRVFGRVLQQMGSRPWQLASAANLAGLRDGSVAGAQVVAQAFAMSDKDDKVVVSLDMKNAFGSVSRRKVQEQVRRVTPELEHIFLGLYGQHSQLFYRTSSNRILALTAERGLPQGSAASSALFGLAIAGCIAKVRAAYPDILVTVYADDISLTGPCVQAAEAAASLARVLKKEVDLVVNPTKTQVMCAAGPGVIEAVREKLALRLDGVVGEVVMPEMVQNTAPMVVLGACITPFVDEEDDWEATKVQLEWSMRWMRQQYGAGAQVLQRGVDSLGALATMHYVSGVLVPGLMYRCRASGPTRGLDREMVHGMICHSLVLRALNLQADPYVSAGVAEVAGLSDAGDMKTHRWRLMQIYDSAVSRMLGLTRVEPGELCVRADTWEGEEDLLVERAQWLELLAADSETYAATYRATPHKEMRKGNAYPRAFARAARLSTAAGGLGLASARFFVNGAVAGWIEVVSRGSGQAFDSTYLTAEDVELWEAAEEGHKPEVQVPLGDLITIGNVVVTQDEVDIQPCMQPSHVIGWQINSGCAASGAGIEVLAEIVAKQQRALEAHRKVLQIAGQHNGCTISEPGPYGEHAPVDESGEIDGTRAKAVDEYQKGDLVFGDKSWFSQDKLMAAAKSARMAFGYHPRELRTEQHDELTEAVRQEMLDGAEPGDPGWADDFSAAADGEMARVMHTCRWRRLMWCVTGEAPTLQSCVEHCPQAHGKAAALTGSQMAMLDAATYEPTTQSATARGAEARIKWLSLLCAADAQTDRLVLASPVLNEFSAMVDGVMCDESDMQRPATMAEITRDDACSRHIRQLAHARDTWNPGTTGWLRQLVSRGGGRLTDEAFIRLLRFRLKASHCNHLIPNGTHRHCGCIGTETLRGGGDPTTQFHLSRCGAGKPRTISWHNRIKRTLAAMLKSLSLRVVQEPRSYVDGDDRFQEQADDNGNRRPDLHVKDPKTGSSALLDVTVTSFTNKSTILRSIRNPMAILDAAAKRKHDVYKQAPNTTQLEGELVAFVVSSSGVIGKEGLRWLKKVTTPYLSTLDRVQERRWRHFWFSSLAEACMVGLAEQMSSQTAHLSAQVIRAGRVQGESASQ